MPRVSEARKEATRQRLIDAAVRVVSERGAEAATTRRILAEAGLSAGALYHYFSSKDELYEAVSRRFADLDAVLTDLPEDITAAQAVDHHVGVLRAMFEPGGGVLLGQVRVSALHNKRLARSLAHYDRIVVERSAPWNRATQRAGLFRADVDAEALVEMLTTFLEGFTTRDAQGAFATDRARVLRLFLEAVFARVVDDTHADAGELHRRTMEVVEQ